MRDLLRLEKIKCNLGLPLIHIDWGGGIAGNHKLR